MNAAGRGILIGVLFILVFVGVGHQQEAHGPGRSVRHGARRLHRGWAVAIRDVGMKLLLALAVVFVALWLLRKPDPPDLDEYDAWRFI